MLCFSLFRRPWQRFCAAPSQPRSFTHHVELWLNSSVPLCQLPWESHGFWPSDHPTISRSEIWTVTLTTKRCTIPSASSGTSSLARSGFQDGTGTVEIWCNYGFMDGITDQKEGTILDPEMTCHLGARWSSLTRFGGVHFARWKVSWLRLCHLDWRIIPCIVRVCLLANKVAG